MDPATVAVLAQLAAQVIDTSIRAAGAAEARAVEDHAARLAAAHAVIVSITFPVPGKELGGDD